MIYSAGVSSTVFDKFRDVKWLQQLAYLADIFQKLNELNLAFQGRQVNIFVAEEKICAMKRKLELWAELVSEGRFSSRRSVISSTRGP